MSRLGTGTQPQTQFGTTTGQPGLANQTVNNPTLRERVAKRAYEKWLKGGCKQGCDKQNWLEAEAEVMAELNRTGTSYSR
jgi:Protein of unknown function (DUF2934)